MPVAPATSRARTAIAKKNQALRDELWPGAEPYLWHRSAHKGFATIPKTLPLLLRIMDAMAPKGAPVSSTYLALWCATWDNSFIALKPKHLAFAAGFGGQRAERTWQARMRTLQQLHFIDIKPGPQGDFAYAIIYNPHAVVRHHRATGTPGLKDADYVALTETAYDIGAKDMIGDEAAASDATAAQPAAPPAPPDAISSSLLDPSVTPQSAPVASPAPPPAAQPAPPLSAALLASPSALAAPPAPPLSTTLSATPSGLAAPPVPPPAQAPPSDGSAATSDSKL